MLESAAKTACAASAKAGPAGGLPWQVAVLDAMPLGPTALDYSFTARGELPKVRAASPQQGPGMMGCCSSVGFVAAAVLSAESTDSMSLQQAVPEHLKKQ